MSSPQRKDSCQSCHWHRLRLTIEKLRKAARKTRKPVRDELLILLAFRHALRVSELVGLTVEQFDLKAAAVHIRRAKNGTPGIHGLQGDELRLIRQLIRENGEHSRFLFLSERRAPLSIDGAQKLIERLGEAAKLPPGASFDHRVAQTAIFVAH